MIIEKVMETKAAKMQQWPVRSNRAGEMGHPCERYLVYNRTRWQEKALPPPSLQLVFDIGKDIEERVMRDIKDAGFQVIEQQRSFEWKEYQITGKVDMKIVADGKVYPAEIKSASPFSFDQVSSIEDMLNSKFVYMQKYPAQLSLYLLMDNKDRGLFIFKNKSTGAMKEIWMDLDYGYAESIVKKAERVNAHVQAGTVPEPMEYDEKTCDGCAFAHICNVERVGKEVSIVDDEELADQLKRYEELKPLAKEFETIDESLKKKLAGKAKLLVGDFYIDGSWRKRTYYDVPEDVKAPFKKESQYWIRKIMRV
ncbi:MAG: hypothetical protein ACE14T_12235 [Syntrophales bacterium]